MSIKKEKSPKVKSAILKIKKIVTPEETFLNSLLHKSYTAKGKEIDQIQNQLSSKKKTEIKHTFTKPKDKELFDAEIEKLKNDGYRIAKKHTKTKIIAFKEKRQNEYFENELWSIFAKMGASVINKNSRETQLPYAKGMTKQLDIFAVFEEVVIICECKCADKPNSASNFNKEIAEIEKVKNGAQSFISKIYPDKKVVYILATKNYIITENVRTRLNNSGIFFLENAKVEYYLYLTESLGAAAKYQFYSEIFIGDKIEGHRTISVNAIKSPVVDNSYFYSFLCSPHELLKISYVFHKDLHRDESTGYQRMVKAKRRKELEEFIKKGGTFSNSIIINFQTDNKIKWKKLNDDGETQIGTLTLPDEYSCAFIIDGQHRLYGYSNLNPQQFNTPLLVTAYVNLPPEIQIKLFIEINNKQKPVPKNLLLMLQSDLYWNHDTAKLSLFSLKTRLLRNLGTLSDSVLNNRIVLGEKKSTKIRCVSIDYIMKYAIDKSNYFGKIKNNNVLEKEGWFFSKTDLAKKRYNEVLKKSYSFLNKIFGLCQKDLNLMWEKGSNDGGLIAMNIGIMSIIRICDIILEHRVENEKDDLYSMTPEEIFSRVKDYLTCVINHINKLNSEEIKKFRSLSTGGIQEQAVDELLVVLHNNHKEIYPERTKKYLKDRSGKYDEEGTKEIKKLQLEIRNKIISTLKKFYPAEDQWFEKGVSGDVQKKCSARRIDEGNKEPQHHYLDLLDYKDIIDKNYIDIKVEEDGEQKTRIGLGRYFSDPDFKGDRKKEIKWFEKLNDLRKKSMHPERIPIKREEYEFIINLKGWLIPKLNS
jgi:DNA sulfur modification protein DndB